MGIVFRAVHARGGNQVAIKTVRAPSGQHLTALRREIRALGRLRHPGVVEIVDHGVADGLPWYAMKLLVGSTLADRLSSLASASDFQATDWVRTNALAALEPTHPNSNSSAQLLPARAPADEEHQQELLGILHDVCTTLAYVHGNGFVHRDLKPSNIFISEDGSPVLVDFGIAAHFASARNRESLSVAGSIAGSAAYMSPEQIRGELVDARSDLYSLGCILHECLTGRTPFPRGTPLEMMNSHLWGEVASPSSRVPGVPAELDELVLRLLEKNPRARIGYADVVANALASFVSRARATSAPTPIYLYRAGFVRNEEHYSVLERHLAELATGKGGVVLLGGESGVGKTRAATELASAAQRQEMMVAVGACLPAGLDPEHEHALMPFRSVLEAVADFCHEAGPQVTEQVIGNRGLLLADVVPAFRSLTFASAQLDSRTPYAETARKRLLDSLRETLLAFAQQRPTLIVLDDLHWADDLSLSLVNSLSAEVGENVPLLILGTYRGPELPPLLQSLRDSGRVHAVDVPRLTRSQVGAMVAEMLSVSEVPASLLDLVHDRSEGVAFFVSEYLMAEIERGAVVRNERGEWALGVEWASSDPVVGRPLQRVREQFLGRVQGLVPVARNVVTLAAVFGREVRFEWLRFAAGIADDDFVDAIQGLRRKQVLDDAGDGVLRFCHEQLRLFAYESASPEDLKALHARVAEVLERFRAGERGLSQVLAYHLSRAQRGAPACEYFCRAGDEYRGTWRNHDAIGFYGSAVREFEANCGDGSSKLDLARLLELRGDAEALAAQFAESAASQRRALAALAEGETLKSARLHRKIGKAATTLKDHDNAGVEYRLSEKLLDSLPLSERSDEWWQEWIELQIERAWWLYWRAELSKLTSLIDACRQDVDARGTPVQRARLLQCLLTATMRAENYRLSSAAAELAAQARSAAESAGDPSVACEAQFLFGFALLFHDDCAAALPELRKAVQQAELQGDVPVRIRALTYLSVAERRAGNEQECVRVAQSVIELARQADMTDYLGAAEANLAWAQWRRAEAREAIQHGLRALQAWKRPPAVYPFQWLARWPLSACLERENDVQGAVACLMPLLDPSQHSLTDESRALISDLPGAGAFTRELLQKLLASVRSRAL